MMLRRLEYHDIATEGCMYFCFGYFLIIDHVLHCLLLSNGFPPLFSPGGLTTSWEDLRNGLVRFTS
jgi:hypothetical protein